MDVATGKRWFLNLLGVAVLVAALRLWGGIGFPRYQGFGGGTLPPFVLDTYTGRVWRPVKPDGGGILFQEAEMQPPPWEARTRR